MQRGQGHVGPAGAVHVENLAADHPGGSGGGGNGGKRPEHAVRRDARRRRGHEAEGVGEQGVASENGGRLVEGLVAGGPPAPEIVVVHCGEVVVDEGIGVDHLQRGGEGHRRIRRQAEQGGGGQAQHGAKPFPARKQAVVHGFLEPPLHGDAVEAVPEVGFHLRAAFGEDRLDLLGIECRTHRVSFRLENDGKNGWDRLFPRTGGKAIASSSCRMVPNPANGDSISATRSGG